MLSEISSLFRYEIIVTQLALTFLPLFCFWLPVEKTHDRYLGNVRINDCQISNLVEEADEKISNMPLLFFQPCMLIAKHFLGLLLYPPRSENNWGLNFVWNFPMSNCYDRHNRDFTTYFLVMYSLNFQNYPMMDAKD